MRVLKKTSFRRTTSKRSWDVPIGTSFRVSKLNQIWTSFYERLLYVHFWSVCLLSRCLPLNFAKVLRTHRIPLLAATSMCSLTMWIPVRTKADFAQAFTNWKHENQNLSKHCYFYCYMTIKRMIMSILCL